MRMLFKFTLPIMGIFMTFALAWGNNQKAWIVFPVLLFTLYLSAAEIRMEGKHIYYRYFFSWRILPDDILDARCTLLPAIGYIRFRHFFPPFGLLLFIVERDSGTFIPFRRTAFMQTMLSVPHSLQNEVNPRIDNDVNVGKVTRKDRLSRVFYLVAGMLAGILIPVPWQYWTPHANQSLLSHFLQIQLYPAVLCFYAGVLAVLIIRNRFHDFANFGLAFVIGTIVAYLARVL
jgi:hypothetical protein